MASRKKGPVFRVTGLPASQANDELAASLKDTIDDNLAEDERSKLTVITAIVPSCYDNAEKVALVEFHGGVPAFLSELMANPFGDWQDEMGDVDISFDQHFFGFTQLYTPEPGSLTTADVIAITGLDGHAYGSWRGKGNLGRMWLRDFLSKDLPCCRTMIYGYNSKMSIHGLDTIMSYGQGLMEELKKLRNTEELRKRPLFFIAHSFGGIILAHCLVKAVQAGEENHPAVASLYRATYGMLLFGIPHKGLVVDDIQKMLAEGSSHPRDVLLQEIKSTSNLLAYQLVDFKNLVRDRKIVSFYETRQTRQLTFDNESKRWKRNGDFVTAVDAESAVLQLPDSTEDKIPLDADHSMIVKFDNRNNRGYTSALDKLRQFEQDAPGVVAARFLQAQNGPKPCSMIPFQRDSMFVGREDILADLERKLGQKALQDHARAALIGLGGVGKSQIAIEYAYRLRESAPEIWVFWVYASSAARFELAYRDIAAKVELPGRDDPKTDILQLVFNWLSDERNGRWLMIIDNADDDRVFSSSSAVLKSGVQAVEGGEVSALSAFLPQTQNGWILVTSRDLVAAMNLVGGREKVTQVEPMGMDDALALLNSRASIDDSSKEDAETLVQTLEYIPLAVTHAAAYIAVRKERFTISSYLELFHESEENQAHLLNKEEIKDIRRDVSVSNAVITTWQISFEQIRQTRPEAANLLSLMAMFDRHGIPAFLLYGGRSRLLFEDAVTPLTSFSLIKPHNINSSAQNARQHMFDMHGLVQLATRKWLGIRSQLETWEGRSIHTMATVFPRADNADRKNMESCQDLLPHARKTLAYIPRDVSVIPERATVAVNVGWYLYLSGGYSEAEKVCRRAYVEIHDLLGPKDMKTIASSALLAKVLISQSKYDEAQAKQEEALRVLQELSPHGDVHTYDVWARLGVICIHKGKYAEAEAYFRKAVEGYSMMAEPDVESTYQTQSQLAISLERQGKLEEAEKIHLEVVKRMQHSGRALNSDSIACMSNLAHLLSKQGQFTKAVQLYQRCTAAYEGIHGPAHPFTLITRGAVGVNLWLANKLPEATQVLRRNLEMEEQTLGTEHENVFMSAYNLALVLQDQSKYAEAETLFIRAIKGLAVIYKMGHPNLDLAMRNFDSLLAKQGRHQEAATLAKALEDPNMLSNTAELCSLIDRLRLGGNSRSSDDNR